MRYQRFVTHATMAAGTNCNTWSGGRGTVQNTTPGRMLQMSNMPKNWYKPSMPDTPMHRIQTFPMPQERHDAREDTSIRRGVLS